MDTVQNLQCGNGQKLVDGCQDGNPRTLTLVRETVKLKEEAFRVWLSVLSSQQTDIDRKKSSSGVGRS